MNVAAVHEGLTRLLEQLSGFIYPNEIQVHWSILIVVYPYLTGLVAGAFILASLVKVFNVTELRPTYRLSLLTALAFLIIAPMPLLLHLGHPLRSWQIFFTPNLSSAMAMFGFVYAWYLMVVLLLEIWFDYRVDLIHWGRTAKFPMNWAYKALSLFSRDDSPESIVFDKKVVKYITILGIPSAFILHGYVGFIFGSIKANPWWSSVLIPIVFLFSAIVSGIALVMLVYMIITPSRGKAIDMACLDKIASFLLYAAIVDFSLEILDITHRLYESEESIKIITEMVVNKLFISLVVLQILIGMIVPLGILIVTKMAKFNQELRKLLYFLTAILIQIGIFSTRWNVVLGGQMFSKSFRGLISYDMEIFGREGFLMALTLLIVPFFILAILIRLLPPWKKAEVQSQ